MQTFTTDEATTRFDEAVRAFCANRLQQTLDQSAEAAARAGLAPAQLDDLLADES